METKVPVVHIKGILGNTVWINPTVGKDKPMCGIVFAQGPGYTWWVMQKMEKPVVYHKKT